MKELKAVGLSASWFGDVFQPTFSVSATSEVTDADLGALERLTLLRLRLSGTQVTDAGLVHVKGLTNLEVLTLYDTQVTDAGLVHLKGLTRLQYLNLSCTPVTDAGLEHLNGLTNLDHGLLSTLVTDAGLKHLKGLTSLRTLELSSTLVTEAGVRSLKSTLPQLSVRWTPIAPIERCPGCGKYHATSLQMAAEVLKLHPGQEQAIAKIRWLEGDSSRSTGTLRLAFAISRRQITDAELEHLKGLTRLQGLNLYGTQVTDAGLVHLKGLTNLRTLGLRRTEVTDAGLVHLEGLTELRDLYLDETQVTDEGVRKLQQALPNCEIHH